MQNGQSVKEGASRLLEGEGNHGNEVYKGKDGR